MNTAIGITSSSRNGDSVGKSKEGRLGTTNITVEISGSQFRITPSLFKHIENLPWKKKKSKPHNNGSLKLNVNPDVFECLLQFFLYSKLPDPERLSSRRVKTLIDFVSPLDPVAVKPLINHLESIVVSRSSSESSSSFMKRSLINMRSSLPSRSSRRKNASTADSARAGATTVSGSNRSSNEENHSNPNTATTRSITSSIPSHIEHPMTKQVKATEISVCSMDESSSISKLSLQSWSTSFETTPGAQAENLVPASSPMVAEYHDHYSQNLFHQQVQLQNPYQQQCGYQQTQPDFEGNVYGMNNRSDSGFDNTSAAGHLTRFTGLNYFAPKQSSSLQNEPHHAYNQNQAQIAGIENYAATTHIDDFMIDVHSGNKKQNDEINHSNEPKQRSPTNLIRKALRGDSGQKRSSTTSGDSDRKSVFNRKQRQMTHADWCASEYVV